MAPDEPLLDMELLDENAEMGLDGLRELIDLYLAQAGQTLGELRTAVAAGAANDVGQLAHKLAGSSAVCGVVAVTSSLREIERCGCEGRLSEIDPLLVETEQRLELCRRLLADYLAEKEKTPHAV